MPIDPKQFVYEFDVENKILRYRHTDFKVNPDGRYGMAFPCGPYPPNVPAMRKILSDIEANEKNRPGYTARAMKGVKTEYWIESIREAIHRIENGFSLEHPRP